MRTKKLKRIMNSIRHRVVKTLCFSKAGAGVLQSEMAGSRLVMTLLARDEADVVRMNIEHHRRHGVDFFIATDNGSVDGTLDVFKEYEKEGLLHLIEERTYSMEQAKWVNRMGAIALEQYGADLIIHADADEFWVASSGNLKTELVKKGYVDCLKVPIWHAALLDRDGAESFPGDMGYLRHPGREVLAGGRWDVHHSAYKVMIRTRRGLPEVNTGNHGLVDKTNRYCTEVSEDIKIAHYGIRGWTHFQRKVVNGASAVAANGMYNERMFDHWRRWFSLYQEGRLNEEYALQKIDMAARDSGLAEGRLVPFDLTSCFPDECNPDVRC